MTTSLSMDTYHDFQARLTARCEAWRTKYPTRAAALRTIAIRLSGAPMRVKMTPESVGLMVAPLEEKIIASIFGWPQSEADWLASHADACRDEGDVDRAFRDCIKAISEWHTQDMMQLASWIEAARHFRVMRRSGRNGPGDWTFCTVKRHATQDQARAEMPDLDEVPA